MRQAVVEEDADALLGCLAPEFQALGRDGPAAVDHALGLWRRYGRTGLGAHVLSLEIRGDGAKGTVEVRTGALGRGRYFLLETNFRRLADGWRATGARRIR
jgi:hypothetical protein